MNKSMYGLMNWPEIEGIVYAECDKPKKLLGGHICDKGFLVQVIRPDAVSVKINVEGRKTPVNMEKVDEAGFFAALIPGKKKYAYTITVEKVNGEKCEYIDPYSFGDITSEADYKAFFAGEETKVQDIFGAHRKCVDGHDGILFTVWAGEAESVSIVGDFNKYDSRVNLMQRIGIDGVFELFIPGLPDNTEYMYEIKKKGHTIERKTDPVARKVSSVPVTASSVYENKEYNWNDSSWMNMRKKNAGQKNPVTIYEVSLRGWAERLKKTGRTKNTGYQAIADSLSEYVTAQGYTHVNLLPVCEYLNEDMNGYATTGYFAPACRYGTPDAFKAMVDTFHKAGVGVIIDWNGAYFGTDSKGLIDFDGSNAYGYLKPTLEKHPDWDIRTFDYSKGAVRSFLISSLLMWIDEYHVDGVRIDGVASMLYLDYGKEPSTWQPNIYGGNENLDAIDFLKQMNKAVAARGNGAITIAEESSGWFGVTAADNNDSLGFTYKQNNCWTGDFFGFINKDPLFRKGEYDRLTYGMLYNYGEDFLLSFDHDCFKNAAFAQIVPEADTDMQLADIRAAIGFMYAHPGSKMLAMGQDIGLPQAFSTDASYWEHAGDKAYKSMEKFIADLNRFYSDNMCMYEQDDIPDGFTWLDNSNADETVIAFERKDSKGNRLTIAVNFTPVDRNDYRLHVGMRGKYKEVFNSAWKIYGQDAEENGQYINSDNDGDGYEYIDVKLGGLSFAVYSCEPYTDIELKEIEVLKKAAIAKKEAMEKAAEAERLEQIAVMEAKRAIEAKEEAERACREAVKAKEDAVRKAENAIKASREIDIQTKKKLESLHKDKERRR